MATGQDITLKNWKPKDWLTDDVLRKYGKLIKAGKVEEAIDFIAKRYPAQIAYVMRQSARKTIEASIARELTEKQIGAAFSDINMMFRVSKTAITGGVRLFTTNVIADYFFQEAGLFNQNTQQKVLNACLGQFESYINGAMANTEAGILGDIRAVQRDWITRNANVKYSSSIDDLLYKSEGDFKLMLRKKYPGLYNAMENGEVLRSRTYIDKLGNPKFKSYTLEEYCDFSVRATILNIDRNSAEIAAHENGIKVVEYYLRDTRPVETEERDVCQHILNKKIHGKSLLALTQEAGNALGIKTIDQARSLGAMFIHCRHSIRPVDEEFNEKVMKVIALNEAAGGGNNENLKEAV